MSPSDEDDDVHGTGTVRTADDGPVGPGCGVASLSLNKGGIDDAEDVADIGRDGAAQVLGGGEMMP
jgi:hypothetical protein